MSHISYSRHRYPPEIIQHSVWLYYRFAISRRDVEDLLAERGIDVSYETVRRWAHKFGPAYARRIRLQRPRPSSRWDLDEVFVRIGGKGHCLWRAVDDEGEVLDILVQSKRGRMAALKFLSTHAAIYNQFHTQRHLISRPTLKASRAAAFAEWQEVVAA